MTEEDPRPDRPGPDVHIPAGEGIPPLDEDHKQPADDDNDGEDG